MQGERVRFEPGLLQSIIARSAPRSFIQHARNPERSVLIGEYNVVFAPAYGSPFVHDMEGGRRYGTLADTDSFENWSDAGAKDSIQRATQSWKETLRSYEPPPMDPAIDEALRKFIAKRKQAMPDIWQ